MTIMEEGMGPWLNPRMEQLGMSVIAILQSVVNGFTTSVFFFEKKPRKKKI